MTSPNAVQRAALRLMRPAAGRRLLLVGRSVFEQRPGQAPQRIGYLFEHLDALANWPCAAERSSAVVLGEARRCVEQLRELRFVVREMVPLLRSIATDQDGALPIHELVSSDLDQLRESATQLVDAVRESSSTPMTRPPSAGDHANLARQLGLPSALVGLAVIPLQPAETPDGWDPHVMIDSQLFRYVVERAYPLENFQQAIVRACESIPRRALACDPDLRQSATDLAAGTSALLAACGSSGRRMRIPFRGAAHFELLHRDGSWVLVYGPERQRAVEGPPIFVGVAIRGRTREERLSIPPTVSRSATDFFVPNGELRRGGLCMGEYAQYHHLLSSRFTDAEALLFWLDAAVVLATGQSIFHQHWRNSRAMRPEHRLYPGPMEERRA